MPDTALAPEPLEPEALEPEAALVAFCREALKLDNTCSMNCKSAWSVEEPLPLDELVFADEPALAAAPKPAALLV
jgi:hypothetical protein